MRTSSRKRKPPPPGSTAQKTTGGAKKARETPSNRHQSRNHHLGSVGSTVVDSIGRWTTAANNNNNKDNNLRTPPPEAFMNPYSNDNNTMPARANLLATTSSYSSHDLYNDDDDDDLHHTNMMAIPSASAVVDRAKKKAMAMTRKEDHNPTTQKFSSPSSSPNANTNATEQAAASSSASPSSSLLMMPSWEVLSNKISNGVSLLFIGISFVMTMILTAFHWLTTHTPLLRVLIWCFRNITLIAALVLFVFSFMPDDHHLELDPPMMLAILGIWYIVNSFWSSIPNWLQKKLDKDDEEDDDSVGTKNASLTSPKNILAKLNEMFELAYAHTQDLPMPRRKVYVCFVTFLHLITELYFAHPTWHDEERRRKEEDESRNYYSTPISRTELEELQLYLELADMAYEESPTELIRKLRYPTEDVVSGYRLIRHDVATEIGRVGHFIAAHHERKEIVIAIKGTSSLSDVLTDLVGKAVPYQLDDGTTVKCHEGMVTAATVLYEGTKHLLESFFLPAKYSIVICGHSLGAGVSCLLGLFYRAAGIPVQVRAYATPACLSYEAATNVNTKSFITSVVNNNDCIPRVSLMTIRSLMELFVMIDDKLTSLGRSPTDWKTTKAYLRDLSKVDDDLLMTPEELRRAKEKCREDDLYDELAIFVPGRVVSIWECNAAAASSSAAAKDISTNNISNSSSSNNNEQEGKGETLPLKEVDFREGDGGMATLREVDISLSMVADHLTESYKQNIKAAIEKIKKNV